MRKTARFTFSALLLCAFAGALVMLTLCARAWASDTFVWTDPTGKTPGQVNVTVIVGNSTYYYIVKNVSFPTVQELVLSLPEEGWGSLTYPSGWWNQSTNPDDLFADTIGWYNNATAEAYTEVEPNPCLSWYDGDCVVSTERFTMTGGIPPGSQTVFKLSVPDNYSPQSLRVPANPGPLDPLGGYAVHVSDTSYCDAFPYYIYGGPAPDPNNPQCIYNPTPYAMGELIMPISPGSRDYSKALAEVLGTIASIKGTVTYYGNPAVAGTVITGNPAFVGQVITLGQALATGPNSSAVINIPDGSILRVYANTSFTFTGEMAAGSLSWTKFVKLKGGRIWATVMSIVNRCADAPHAIMLEPCDAFDFTTANAVAGVRGTDLVIVATATTTTVTVNEGTVEVDNLVGGTLNGSTLVQAGSTLTVTSYESFSPASYTFANQVIDKVSANTKVTFKYSGTGTLTLSSLVASTNYSVNTTGITSGACNLTGNTSLAANQTCAFNVAFTPTSLGTITGTVTANFTGDPNGFTSAQLPLSGTGTEVTLSPASLAFGTVTTSKTLSVTVKNVGTTTLIFSSTPTITGTGAANFAVLPYSSSPATSTCLDGAALAQNQTCTYTVRFTGGVGTTSIAANLNIFDNGGGIPQVVKMTGNETEVKLTPATLAFGTITGTETLSMAVQNLGTTPLTFSKAPTVTGTGAANFAVQPYIAGTQSTCLETGLTLTQNQICTYTVKFTDAGGTTAFTTYLNIFDNGGGSPQLEKMTAKD